MPSTLVVLDSEPARFTFAAWKNVVLAVWRSHATIPAIERLAKAVDRFAEISPGRRSNVHIIANGIAAPPPEARTAFVELMKRNAASVACVGVVVDGEGFWAGGLRAAISGMHLQAPRSFDLRLLANADEVVGWLPARHHEKTGVRLDPGELRAAIAAAVGEAP